MAPIIILLLYPNFVTDSPSFVHDNSCFHVNQHYSSGLFTEKVFSRKYFSEVFSVVTLLDDKMKEYDLAYQNQLKIRGNSDRCS